MQVCLPYDNKNDDDFAQHDQYKVSADQYHVTISQVQVYNSLRSHVFSKLTADQIMVFNGIVGSSQVNLLKTGQDCLEPVNASPRLKFIEIITFFLYTNVFLRL